MKTLIFPGSRSDHGDTYRYAIHLRAQFRERAFRRRRRRVHGATDGHLRRLWQRFSPDPLHGEKGGQLRYPLCVGKWNAEHGPGV